MLMLMLRLMLGRPTRWLWSLGICTGTVDEKHCDRAEKGHAQRRDVGVMDDAEGCLYAANELTVTAISKCARLTARRYLTLNQRNGLSGSMRNRHPFGKPAENRSSHPIIY